MAGEMRYIGVGEESTFGTPVAATDFMDFSRAEVNVPSNPIAVFERASGRFSKVIASGVYIPSGSLELPVDSSRCVFAKNIRNGLDVLRRVTSSIGVGTV